MDALGVLNLAQAGDARAEKIVHHRAGIVADIIVNLSLILNPGLILLEGEVGSHPTLIGAGTEAASGERVCRHQNWRRAIGQYLRALGWNCHRPGDDPLRFAPQSLAVASVCNRTRLVLL